MTFSSGFAANNLTNEGGAYLGYGGSNQDGYSCSSSAFCGSGSGGTGATSYFYVYYQTPTPATGLYNGASVLAPGVTAISTTGDTAGGVNVAGLATLNFKFNENPEWYQSGTNNFGVILTLGKFYSVNGGACNVKLLSVVAPLNSGAAADYALPLSGFSVIQDCGTGLSTAAAALASAPVVAVDFQGDGGSAALPAVGGLTTGANLSVPTGSPPVYPTTVALTGGISFQPAAAPAPQSLVLSSGFAANNLTNEGGAYLGYGGSNQDGYSCSSSAFCGSGSGGSGSTSYFYVYYQTPTPATGLYNGMSILAPGVSAISATGDTAGGLQVTTQKTLNFKFNENPEWYQSGTNNFGVILTLGKFYSVNGGACNVKLLSVVAPLNGGAAADYALPLSGFSVIQDCGTGLSTAAAALASAPVVAVDFQGDGGTAALPAVGGLTTGANLSVPTGSPPVYPTTVAVTGGVTFEP